MMCGNVRRHLLANHKRAMVLNSFSLGYLTNRWTVYYTVQTWGSSCCEYAHCQGMCTSSADTRAVLCKSLQWQREGEGHRLQPCLLSASCEHHSRVDTRQTGRRTITGATKGRMVHVRHQMNKWFIEISSAFADSRFYCICPHLKGKRNSTITRKTHSAPFSCNI